MPSPECSLFLFTCSHRPACRQRKACWGFQVKDTATFYQDHWTITWNTSFLCCPESKHIGAWGKCLGELSTSSQRRWGVFQNTGFCQGAYRFCYFNISSLLSMGFVTYISGGIVFLTDTLEALFVAKSQTFPDLAGHGDGCTTGDNLLVSLDTAWEVRQGWTALSPHKVGTLSALWGGPSCSASSGGRLTHVGHSTVPFLLHSEKKAWHFQRKMTLKALRQRRGKHDRAFWKTLSSCTHANHCFIHLG